LPSRSLNEEHETYLKGRSFWGCQALFAGELAFLKIDTRDVNQSLFLRELPSLKEIFLGF
jgi:hypothetical protein